MSAQERLSRRQLLGRAGVAAGSLAVAAGVVELASGSSHHGPTLGRSRRSTLSSAQGLVTSFHSRPDLRVPAMASTARHPRPGYVFLGPGSTSGLVHGPPASGSQQGAMIIDGTGELVWFRPRPGAQWATNVRVQEYRGAPVLTWWEGKVIDPGFGQGVGRIFDRSYREVAQVRAGNGRVADLHEFRLTPQGTALITCYPEMADADLTSYGGPVNGTAIDSIFQEVDVSSGRVLLEWHGLDHIAVTETYQPYNEPYDFLHINSIDVLPDGNLLVCARATWALYKLDRHSGEVIWRLGGRESDFALGPGARFTWQHDAAPAPGGRITVFDDGAGPVPTEPHSRGIVLDVDEARRTVSLVRALGHPGKPVLATAMGSIQSLPGGGTLVGWGTEPYTTEFDASGVALDDLSTRAPELLSYRAYRYPWSAAPHEPPTLVARAVPHGRSIVLYVSWNGATEAVAWRVHAGTRARELRPIGQVARRGFETAIPVHASSGSFAVAALDRAGRTLSLSPTVTV